MSHYIDEARSFLAAAEEEFQRGRASDDRILMRDACEKAWGAVIQAVNALSEKKGVTPLPKSHRDRRLRIRELEAQDEEIRRRNLYDRFMARDYFLHQRAFYDGDMIPEEVEAEFGKVRAFIEDIDAI